jgi:hypothetical protein
VKFLLLVVVVVVLDLVVVVVRVELITILQHFCQRELLP